MTHLQISTIVLEALLVPFLSSMGPQTLMKVSRVPDIKEEMV